MALYSKIGYFQRFVPKYGVDKSTCPHMFRRPCNIIGKRHLLTLFAMCELIINSYLATARSGHIEMQKYPLVTGKNFFRPPTLKDHSFAAL